MPWRQMLQINYCRVKERLPIKMEFDLKHFMNFGCHRKLLKMMDFLMFFNLVCAGIIDH